MTDYDGQGRPVGSKFYSLGQYQWETTTAYPGADETDVTPPPGGTATSAFTDALGQTTASWAYDDSATPTGKASDARVTSYTYTPGGQAATVADSAGNKWTYGYNLLGQLATQTDPDAGTTTYAYDPDGNQISSTDPRGQTLSYTYDALNRKTAEYSGSVSPADELASWTYDTLAKGQVTSSASYAGGASGPAYTEAITGYNDAYQPTGTSLTIPAAEGSLAGTYTTADTYSPVTNELKTTAYSADGGLPAETVHYSYDAEGLVSSIGGAAPYLDTIIYDPFGNVQRTTTGLNGSQLSVTSAYDAGTQRLLQTTDNAQTASSAVDTTNYTYDDSGAVTSASDAQNTGQTDTQCFAYNDLSELTTAWTDTAGTSTAPAPSAGGIGGCDTATPSASTIGGPSPYWESWTYDPLGDRTSETTHNTAGDTADNQTQTLAYPGADGTTQASQPNAVSAVATTGPGGTTNTTYAYNPAGDTTGRTSTSTGASPPAGLDQTFTYNPQDQVSSVTTTSGGTAQTSDYLYDADGNLLIQRDPGTTTLYLDNGAEELQLNTSANTVSGTRYYSEPDGTTVVRSSAGPLTYELGNQQGTSTETINAATLAVTRRYYDPYGNPRGSVPSSWADNRGFLNQPADATTGLDLLGARQYDPVTGRFLSVDSVFEAGDPRQMGGYSYAADNPASGSDPEGTMFVGAGGGVCGMRAQACTGGGGGSGGGGSGGGGSGGGGSQLGTGCWEPGGEYICGAPGSSSVAPALTAPSFTPPKPTVQGGRLADPYTCGRIGTGCSPIPASSKGDSLRAFARKAAQVVGNVIGVNAIMQCWRHASLGTCSTALLVIGMDVSELATFGADAPWVTAADTTIDATVDASAEVGGDGISAASNGTDDVGNDAATSCSLNSFTGSTRVLLADGKTIPIDRVSVGDKVLATDPIADVSASRPVTGLIVHSGPRTMTAVTLAGGATIVATDHHLFWDATAGAFIDKVAAVDTKTGKNQAETVTAVLVHHDTDLYNLAVRSDGRTEIIHTTSNHLFWDPYQHQWISSNKLANGERLLTANGAPATVVGGSVPAVHDGWMWDLTVPGNNDHDFYVLAVQASGDAHVLDAIAESTPILVHNDSCGPGEQYVYRAVKSDELEQIQSTRQYANIPGQEVKFFSTTPEGAAQYAKAAYGRLPDEGAYTLTRGVIPSSAISPLSMIDSLADGGGGIEAFALTEEEMSQIGRVRILPYMPVP